MQKKLEKQRAFFRSGRTIPLAFRKKALKRLGRAIRQHEKEIYAALREDLNKSKTETFMCEVGMTLAELSYMLKHLEGWAKKKYVRSPLAQFSATSFTVKEPYGVALIMSPWNYPFMLTMEPLIGAIAAGNCAVVKPSAYAPATSAVIRRILRACFPEEYIFVVEGGRAENQALLDQRFDYIFFTGGVTVGKEVMAKAAKHLTPVTLELGGKSPCVVDRTAKLELAAKRIAFGKLLNCGQTCVAPDYILVERSVKDEFLVYLKKWIVRMYGADATENDAYVKMINQKHFDRVTGLIDPEKVIFGGGRNERTMQIQPTILDDVTAEDAVMQEEMCNAEFARRVGEEYLYQIQTQTNIDNLRQYNFSRLLAACPHCFNTLKNEYPEFERGQFNVISHLQFIAEQMDSGRLKAELSEKERVAIHDACYYARYNGIVNAPRFDLNKVKGLETVDPKEWGTCTTCCGAGGGQFWTDTDAPERLNVIRLKAVVNDTGCDKVATSCPFCLSMFDSAKSQEKSLSEISISDIAEIIAKNLK